MAQAEQDAVTSAIHVALTAHRPQLLALVRRRVGASIDAEDIVQAAFERALARRDQLRDAERADAWVGRIVRNVLIDELRKRRTVRVSAEVIATDDVDVTVFDCDCALVQLTMLKAEYADILRRVVVEGDCVTKVAIDLGLTANNAMVRLHRAKKALRAQLEAHCGTTSARACVDCGCRERRCCETS